MLRNHPDNVEKAGYDRRVGRQSASVSSCSAPDEVQEGESFTVTGEALIEDPEVATVIVTAINQATGVEETIGSTEISADFPGMTVSWSVMASIDTAGTYDVEAESP